jgi:tripeptide aminopeptidase
MSSANALSPAVLIRNLLDSPAVQRAFEFVDSHLDEITEEQIRICSIPAPPFGEQQRAEYLRQRFLASGLADAKIDEEGNCLALRSGRANTPFLVVSAHLDTVFPAGTDTTVRREGSRLLAPGISDDGCGLAALIAIADALRAARIETEGSLLFVGTVGEEGEGNLRRRKAFANGWGMGQPHPRVHKFRWTWSRTNYTPSARFASLSCAVVRHRGALLERFRYC